MALQRIKLNRGEVRKMLRGEGQYAGVAADLDRRAANIATGAGDGMEVDGGAGRNRYRASVYTADADAVKAEAEQRALTRALDAGRS